MVVRIIHVSTMAVVIIQQSPTDITLSYNKPRDAEQRIGGSLDRVQGLKKRNHLQTLRAVPQQEAGRFEGIGHFGIRAGEFSGQVPLLS